MPPPLLVASCTGPLMPEPSTSENMAVGHLGWIVQANVTKLSSPTWTKYINITKLSIKTVYQTIMFIGLVMFGSTVPIDNHCLYNYIYIIYIYIIVSVDCFNAQARSLSCCFPQQWLVAYIPTHGGNEDPKINRLDQHIPGWWF